MPPGLRDTGVKLTFASKIFKEKTARERTYQYDGVPSNGGHEWRSDMFDYMVSKCPAAGPWLSWTEEHGAEEITRDMLLETLNENSLMTDDMDPTILSHHIWGFLLHCLTGAAKQTFKSVAREDGSMCGENSRWR